MQLKPAQLEKHLAGTPAPLYFISGDEPLRLLEAADAVRSRARDAGFTEREVLTVQPGFDWTRVRAGADNLSLFGERRIIDLRIPTGKPGKEGAQVLREYAAEPPADTLLLVTAGRLEPAARKSKWVEALDAAGVVVFVWPLAGGELAAWLRARLQRRGLRPTDAAVSLLAERIEGNLLAGVQEIDKLCLLQGAGDIDADDIARAVADSARFDVNGLADSALAGDGVRSVRILNGLRGEGVAPPLVLWALARDIRQLVAITDGIAAGGTVPGMLGKYRVWASRRSQFTRALERLSRGDCRDLLRRCAVLDRVIKGQAPGSAWDELLQLTLRLSGTPALEAPEPAGSTA